MAKAEMILEHLRDLGVRVAPEGEHLAVTFSGELSPQVEPLLLQLREHKAELLFILGACDPATGKEKIRQTLHQISDLWNAIEHTGGSIAWEWILRGSPHGERIQQAEDKVNTIGSRGNPAALKAACDAWVSAWRDGIEAWKRHLPATNSGLGSIQKVRQ